MAKNFLDWGGGGGGEENKPNLEIQEAEWIPDKIKSKKPIQRHIILMKSKEKWKLFRLEKKKTKQELSTVSSISGKNIIREWRGKT